MLHIMEHRDCRGKQGVKSDECLGAKERLRNREMTKMSCFKGVVIKNYTENSAKLPGCLNHRGKSTHCANKKNMLFSQCITPFQIHCCNGRNVPSYTEKEIVFKVSEACGGAQEGGTYWETLRYSRGHSSAKDF